LTRDSKIHTIGQSVRQGGGLLLKEQYFSSNTIDAKAVEMRQAAEKSAKHGNRFGFVPSRSALLVLDMQSYFLDDSSHAYVPSARAIIPRVATLITAFAALKLPIIFTRHINTAENAQLMSRWWRETITGDNPLSQIVPEVDQSKGKVIEKCQYDAFFKTIIDEFLHARDVRQVVISGVMTHLCCESTARSAFMRGYEVFFLVDGTATYNESFHQASLTNLSHGFAEMKLVSEILDSLQSGHDA